MLSTAFTRGIGGHHRPGRGATDEWLTPPDMILSLGSFDLDPCAPVTRPWPTAQQHLTETRFFHAWGWQCADAMLFLKGRINFHFPDGTRSPKNAGGPSVLIAYGTSNADALERCNIPGAFVRLIGGAQ